MGKMVSWLGKDVTERVFLDRFTQLCTDTLVLIRKTCALHVSVFASVISKEAFKRALVRVST